jgi:hypothetical protein
MDKKQEPNKQPKPAKTADKITKEGGAKLSEEDLKRVSGGVASIKVAS